MNKKSRTLSQTINALVRIGYTHDFNIQDEHLTYHQTNRILSPSNFQIDQVYRFEGASDPADQSILYAISSTGGDIKGTLVNGYGISSNERSSKLVKRLQTNQTHISMEDQSIRSTPQRPAASQVSKNQLVEMNLHKFINKIKKGRTWTNSDQKSITIFKSETLRMVLIGLHKDAEIKPHKSSGVISVQLLKGKINFITEQKSSLLGAGQLIALQANITHSVVALKESFFLLTLAMNCKED